MLHLLVVEDSVELADNLAEILQGAGFSTGVVHSAEQALAAVLDEHFDAIVSDLRLPHMSGVELLQHLRSAGRSTPLILMSAFADERAQATARGLGAAAVLIKPFDCGALLALLASLFDPKRAPSASRPRQ